VRRSLPAAQRQAVGPFLFFDHFGPITAHPGDNHDVRPHPHIGLATVTYLFDGALEHRDSTGAVQRIEPGGVNWMTAGRGVTHSERSPADQRAVGGGIAGLQTWVALPDELEEVAASFQHAGALDLPLLSAAGVALRLLAGSAFGERSPVVGASPLFHVDADLAAGARLALPSEHADRAVLVIAGEVEVAGVAVPERHLAVVEPGDAVALARTAARIMTFGGSQLGPRFIWWNFVSSRRERIDEAAADWRAHRFAGVPGDPERVELP
jgi:hypothetical protein